MSECAMVSRTPAEPKATEKPEPLGLRELSFEKALLEGREVLWPIDKQTGARLAGVLGCGITSGIDKPTVMHLEIELAPSEEA